MKAIAVQEAESVTRSMARWCSIVAAIIFAIAFATDAHLSWDLVVGQAIQIALVVSIFAGYALAWTRRFEALGSVIALVAIIAVCVLCSTLGGFMPSPAFLAVGAPALLHLMAIALHRHAPTSVHA